MSILKIILPAIATLLWVNCFSQSDSALAYGKKIPEKYLSAVSDKVSSVDKKLSKRTLKLLRKFEEEEGRIIEKLATKDSAKAKELVANGFKKIENLRNELINMPDKAATKLTSTYNAYIDTLQTSLKFLQQKGEGLIVSSGQISEKLKNVTGKINVLDGKFQKADEIKKYLRERKSQLKQELEKFGMVKELRKIEKATYYYNEYVKEYKEILQDRKKLERKAMALLYSTSLYKKFISENTLLASLFKMPTGNPGNIAIPTLAGVQTRASVNEMIQTAISAGGPNAYNQVRQQIQEGQAQLSVLKNKIAQYGSADAEIPTFKPNSQKTKSFLKRLEYGANIQFGKSNQFMPTTSDIALSLGYKINDKSSIGIGASYKLGLGSGWNNIRLTNEGLGLRSYIDWKIKGGFYLSGGYEQNYNSQFKNIGQLKQYSSWQTAGLIGLTKKVKLKGGKSTKIQIMYDFLSYSHTPTTQPFVFRTGFNLK